jgi:hypothetical protein
MTSARTFLLAFLILPLVVGCVSLERPHAEVTVYGIELSRAESADSGKGAVISIREFDISPLFENKFFTYRTGENTYETDFYNQTLTTPAEMLTEGAIHWLSRSPLVSQVSTRPGRVKPTHTLEGRVEAFYGDYRDESEPKAVLSVALTLIDERAPERKSTINRVYSEAAPLERISPRVLASGWREAFKTILTAFEADLKATL